MRSLFIILIVVISLSPCFAQTLPQKLDNYFSAVGNSKEFNGNVLVAENGTVIYKRSFGYADFETKRANNDASEFQIASVTKTFTATAVLQLRDKGKLKLDDKFAKYFPDFPYPTITIRQMLSHTSGLPDYEVFTKLIEENPDKIFQNQDIIPAMKTAKMPLGFTPGEKWSYCNLNFDLLALLVEKLSGQRFEEYLKKNIFEPAKMTKTYVKTAAINTTDSSDLSYNFQYQFRFSSEPLKIVKNLSNPFFRSEYYSLAFIGDAHIYTTTGDLLRYDNALYSNILLKNETLEEAFTPTKLNNGELSKLELDIGGMGVAFNGLGWFIFEDTSGGKIVWHTGGMPGARSILLRNLTKKQTVIVLDNAGSSGIYRRGRSAMNILNGKAILNVKRNLTRIYGNTLIEKGSDAAAVLLLNLRSDADNYSLIEDEMNNMAYEMLEQAHVKEALETFKINILLFPASDNVYESYGEGLLKSGNKEAAVVMFNKTLKINPDNEDAKKMLEKIKTMK